MDYLPTKLLDQLFRQVAETFQSHVVAKATGLLCLPIGLIAGTIVGRSLARSQRKREFTLPSLS
jgi:hypothetical protein